MAVKPGDVSQLNDSQAYVVSSMRAHGGPIKPHRSNEPLIMLGNKPVCTWDTLFFLLGREVLTEDEDSGGYVLTAAWAKDPRAKA